MKHLILSLAFASALAGNALAAEQLPPLPAESHPAYMHPAIPMDQVKFIDRTLQPAYKPGEFVIREKQPLPAMTAAQLAFGFERGKALEQAIASLSPAERQAMLEILQQK